MAGGTRSFEFARRLVEFGHEVNLVTSWREPTNRKEWFSTEESGVVVHWLPVPYTNAMSYGDRVRAFLRFAVLSARKLASIRTDVVFATSTPLTIALPGVYGAWAQSVPMVFEVRDLWPEMPIAVGAIRNPMLCTLARSLEKWAYDNAATIIALSPGMKDGVVRRGYPADRVAVIPNGSDNDAFSNSLEAAEPFLRSRPWLRDRPLIVYAGTFGRLNGLAYAVDLARELDRRKSKIGILLVGDGSERGRVLARASELGLVGRNLFFEGAVPKKEVPALLAAATFGASFFADVPEMRSNSANKFFDVLAASKPVLVNYGGWMHDLVVTHQCGFSAWEMSVETAASALDRLASDPMWLQDAGRASRLLAERYFDRDLLARQFEQVLMAAVEGRWTTAESIAPGNFV